MTTFDERERGFEAKFAHDQDLQFRLTARRDKLFAEWAAKELKLSDADKAELTRDVLHIADGPGHDERLLTFIGSRFAERADFPLDTWLGANLASCGVEAHLQIIEPAVMGKSPT